MVSGASPPDRNVQMDTARTFHLRNGQLQAEPTTQLSDPDRLCEGRLRYRGILRTHSPDQAPLVCEILRTGSSRYRAQVASYESWSDDPITQAGQDRFDRARFAGLIGETIDAVPLGSASTVFGLVGPWGSGKSSVAELIRERLPASWIVQSFTPWAAVGVVGLQLEFVAALDAALGGVMAEEQSARETLKKAVRLARPLLSAIPGLADSAETAVDQFAERKPWSVEFDSLSASLAAIEKRVLIICDDIDRLDAGELLTFLKVVRLLGRFPNVHYLVAYDADTVEDLLAAEGVAGRTSSFMEKIVQHPFELPQIDWATRWQHLSGAVTRMLEVQKADLDEQGIERFRLLVDALSVGLTTPRQFARFEQHIAVLARLVPGEVDPLDFAAVAYLRLNHHEVYEALPSWSPDLRAGLRGSNNGNGKNEGGGLPETEWQSRLSATSRRSNLTGIWDVLTYLYPSLRANPRAPLHAQAFADPLYEERYYSLGVPENDVSDVLVGRAISSWLGIEHHPSAEHDVALILAESHGSIARLAIEKLRAHRRKTLPTGAPVGRLVRFLHAEYSRSEASKNEPDSPAEPLIDWLVDEVVRGYASSEFDHDGLIQLLGEQLALEVVLLATASFGSARNPDSSRILADFAARVRGELEEPGSAGLEPWALLRDKVRLVDRAREFASERTDMFDEAEVQERSGLLDGKVDGDVALFESTAVAMVRVARWRSGSQVHPKLEFDTQMWFAAVSEEVREKMVAELTDVHDSAPIDIDDVSESNQRRFAIVRARSEFSH